MDLSGPMTIDGNASTAVSYVDIAKELLYLCCVCTLKVFGIRFVHNPVPPTIGCEVRERNDEVPSFIEWYHVEDIVVVDRWLQNRSARTD